MRCRCCQRFKIQGRAKELIQSGNELRSAESHVMERCGFCTKNCRFGAVEVGIERVSSGGMVGYLLSLARVVGYGYWKNRKCHVWYVQSLFLL